MEQAIFNLIDKAVKFSDGAVAVAGSVQNEHVCLCVRDHGGGIAKQGLQQLFEPFYRGRATAPGTGLGLAICRGIITVLGGKITISSPVISNKTDPRGTEAPLHLPAHKGASE